MSKRGDCARQNLTDWIINVFGDKFIKIQDKKIYVLVKDIPFSEEEIPFAITITMPKTPIQEQPIKAEESEKITEERLNKLKNFLDTKQ